MGRVLLCGTRSAPGSAAWELISDGLAHNFDPSLLAGQGYSNNDPLDVIVDQITGEEWTAAGTVRLKYRDDLRDLPCYGCDTSDEHDAPGVGISLDGSWTYFWVGKCRAGGYNDFHIGNPTAGAPYMYLHAASGNSVKYYYDGGIKWTGVNHNTNIWRVIVVRKSGNAYDSMADTIDWTTPTSPTAITPGQYFTQLPYLQRYDPFAQVAWYNRSLTDLEVDDNITGLVDKWGVDGT
jgi:hypothetical protein